ncbi:MAG: hypothetical protein L3J96_04350, partial [Thermoplasmata archaeon]|nr:hypothetical protein [Thermoplasmata archaeon]
RMRYGRVPELQKQLEQMEKALHDRTGGSLLREEVEETDVAEVIAKWSGVPASRLLEGESQRLLAMEEELKKRVIGQDEAVEAVAKAVRRSR